MTQIRMEEMINKVGGPFRLTVLVQKRINELKKGEKKLVDYESDNLMKIVYEEILQDKIQLVQAKPKPRPDLKQEEEQEKEMEFFWNADDKD